MECSSDKDANDASPRKKIEWHKAIKVEWFWKIIKISKTGPSRIVEMNNLVAYYVVNAVRSSLQMQTSPCWYYCNIKIQTDTKVH